MRSIKIQASMGILIRIERHRQGPRLFLFGVRIHEVHLGLAIVASTVLGAQLGLWRYSSWTGAALVIGAYMAVKDARDLLSSTRDTGAWRIGMHRRFAPLRAMRYADGLPSLAGWIAFAIGIVNLASALSPSIAWRGHLLLQVMPMRAVPLFHSIAVPASLALIVASLYLRRRRHRAWAAAFALLVALGGLDLLKGLDFEEALLSWGGASLLWWGRDSFCVQSERVWKHPLLWTFASSVSFAAAVVAGLVWLSTGRTAEPRAVVDRTIALLAWTDASPAYTDEFHLLPIFVDVLVAAAIVSGAWLLFRPRRPPRTLPDERARQTALELVRAHGSDTLAFFKLREDMHYLFTGDRRAFLGYRIENNVLLVAGDPVGPAEALPELVTETCAFAEVHGLRIAALGASKSLVALWRQAGLNAMYIGDEGIVRTREFSLEGRSIRKVRQSVSRLEKAGFVAELHRLAELRADEIAELERVSSLWRGGVPERGFSMAMDALTSERCHDSVVVVTRDIEGVVRGFLHFVPSYGRAAMSLSFMRRDRETPNGLTEFLVVRAIELLRERGVDELSLNFAAFGRLLERPGGRFERVLSNLVVLGSRHFQMESLYRFNAKFSPRWEPRYFVFEGVFGFPRAGLAAMSVEGLL
jgi:lysyl-tRNA synthetase class 2